MNVDAYNLIIDQLQPLFKHADLKAVDTEDGSYFINSDRAIKITFNEASKVFELSQCGVSDEKPDEGWQVLTSYLFLDDYTIKDAKSVANEFEDTLRDSMGIKPASDGVNTSAIPTPDKSLNVRNVETLTAKFLQIFPQYKDEYAKYVAESGQFLYASFYTEIASPLLLNLLKANDKKRLVKYFEMLNEHYCQGDNDVRSVVSVIILGETLKGEPEALETAKAYIEEYKYLKTCLQFSLSIL